MDNVKLILPADKDMYEKDKALLLELLQKVRVPNILRNRRDASGNIIGRQRENVIGTIGRTCNFGLVRSRRFGYINSRHTTKWADLHNAIFKFGNHVCPIGMDVTSVTLNHNVKAKKHIDGFNVGDSVIVGIGTYEGGKLRVYENDNFTAFDICDRPLMLAQNTHMKQKTLQATVIQLFIIAKDQRQNHGFLKLLLLVQELLKIYPYIMTNNEN